MKTLLGQNFFLVNVLKYLRQINSYNIIEDYYISIINVFTMSKDFKSKSIKVGKRRFYLKLIRYQNGGFLSLSEGNQSSIGSVILAIKAGGMVESTTIIPEKRQGILLTVLSHVLAEYFEGLALVSLYISSEISQGEAKIILASLKKLLDKIIEDEQKTNSD